VTVPEIELVPLTIRYASANGIGYHPYPLIAKGTSDYASQTADLFKPSIIIMQ
jgi:hypothetical protein